MKDEKNQVTATTTKNENNVAENNKKAKKGHFISSKEARTIAKNNMVQIKHFEALKSVKMFLKANIFQK